MTVQINRSDQLIGSNWIRKANTERPTVGRVLPTVGCPPRAAHRGQVEDFGTKFTDFHCMTAREICFRIFFESCWAY